MLTKRRWILSATLVALLGGVLILVGCARQGSISPKPSRIILPSGQEVLPTAEPGVETELTPHPTLKEPETAEEECYKDPKKALDAFLSYLHNGQYEKAARLYGGNGYPNRRTYPPEMTVEERIKVEAQSLANFCTGYSTCLKHKIVGKKITSEDEVSFTVQFIEENGQVFKFVAPFADKAGYGFYRTVGPDFTLRVKSDINGCYKSMDVPPITP
jgi:hypothetical protein